MMDRPLISVIVPVYNAEEYLERCVSSITGQTMKELEIVLVDDGSPDNCPELCDRLAKNDERIRVIHKPNGGVSTARNTGLDNAKAGLIAFVDSDDFADPDMCRVLYEQMGDAEVSAVSITDHYKYIDRDQTPKSAVKAYTGAEALGELLRGRNINGSLCGKLFRKELFDSVRFTVGRTYEDALIFPDILINVKKVVVSAEPLYVYWHRPGSITTGTYSARALDIIYAYEHTLDVVKEKAPELIPEAQFRLYWAYFVVLDRMLYVDGCKKLPEYKEVCAFLKKNWKNIKNCGFFMKSRRIAGVAVKAGMPFYKIMWRMHEKVLRIDG